MARWAFLVAPEVRQHGSENMTVEHRNAIEKETHHLYFDRCLNRDPKIIGRDIVEVAILIWDNFKCFEKKTKHCMVEYLKCRSG